MGLILCSDPFVKSVRDVYRANVVSAPTVSLAPLQVVAQRGAQFDLRGDLAEILDGTDEVDLPVGKPSPVAALTGERTAGINVSLAAELSAKFLNGLGVPVPAAAIEATLFKGGEKVSFEVLHVQERAVDLGELGSRLAGRRINKENPAVSQLFFGPDPARMLLVTRVLQSPSFGVHVNGDSAVGVSIDVDAVKELLGKAGADVSWSATSTSSIVFTGKRPASFAFSVINCNLKPDGTMAFGMEVKAKLLDPSTGDDHAKVLPIEEPPLTTDVGLIDFERRN